MIELAVLLVLALASYRITRFVVFDTLIEGTRERLFLWLINHQKGKTTHFLYGKILDLLSCTFCAGFWVTLLLTSLYFGHLPWEFSKLEWISTAGVTGLQALLHTWEYEDDHEH